MFHGSIVALITPMDEHRMAYCGQGIRLPLQLLNGKYHETLTIGLKQLGLA